MEISRASAASCSRGATRPSCARISRQEERRREMPGAFCTRGFVCKDAHKNAHESNRYRRSNPAFPAQWFYGLCRALLGDEFVLSPSLADQGLTEPGRARKTSAGLAPATGVGTTRFCRTLKASFVVCAADRSRVEPALRPRLRADALASTASRPNVRDDGQRPSSGTGWRDL
jgi:hypothetical protein